MSALEIHHRILTHLPSDHGEDIPFFKEETGGLAEFPAKRDSLDHQRQFYAFYPK